MVLRDHEELDRVARLELDAELIAESTLFRMESCGLHYTLDYPDLLPQARDTALRKD